MPLRYFVEIAVCRKRSHSPTLTLTQIKCSHFSAFHWSTSINKSRTTLVSFIKIMESFTGRHQSTYLVWLMYPSSRLLDHTRFANESYKVRWLGHHLGIPLSGMDRNGWTYIITTSDQIVQALRSCNTWLWLMVKSAFWIFFRIFITGTFSGETTLPIFMPLFTMGSNT